MLNNRTQETPSGPYLEPRVAKLEAGLEMLTRDVASLAQVVRDQGNSIERQIRDLAIGVTQAAAPKKTDWPTLIALAMLIMAVGSAVFWPLNQTSQNNKDEIKNISALLYQHQALNNHPVGEALIDHMERAAEKCAQEQRQRLVETENKLRDENKSNSQMLQEQIKALVNQQSVINERMYARMLKLEAQSTDETDRNMQELQAWRQKAMGLDSVILPPSKSSASSASLAPDAVTHPQSK